MIDFEDPVSVSCIIITKFITVLKRIIVPDSSITFKVQKYLIRLIVWVVLTAEQL